MPQIFEVWTSAQGRITPKRVFAPGESIQWNIFHRADNGELGQAYDLHFNLERIGNSSVSSEDTSFDVLWAIHRTYLLPGRSYEILFPWDFIWWDAIPDTSNIDIPTDIERDEVLQGLSAADWNIVLVQGYWRFTAIVQMREPETSGAFDFSDTWMYRIIE